MNNKNLPLFIALGLPIIFIVILAIIIYIPRATIQPTHDFLFMNENDYYVGYYENTFKVVDGTVTVIPSPITDTYIKRKIGMPTLYRYDVKNDTSREISLTDAQELTLDVGPSSVDGYTVSYEYSHDGIFELFGSSNNGSGYFIRKGNAKKRIQIANDYSRGFTFIGWIK